MKCWIFLAWITVAESSISWSPTVCVLERVQLQYTVTAADLAVHTGYKHHLFGLASTTAAATTAAR
jgi:hypothetical protein